MIKLRNKKTGAIYNIEDIDLGTSVDGIWLGMTKYDSLAELNEEWEDYEEPEEYWWIDASSMYMVRKVLSTHGNIDKEIGNYFGTEEEAEKAVEKLKAWKRLKDKGFRFGPWNSRLAGEDHLECCGHINIDASIEPYSDCRQDLDICFGGEE